jgi:hypothetical protein
MMTVSTASHTGAAFRAAAAFAEAIHGTPEWEEWERARAAAKADTELQRLVAHRRELLDQTYRVSEGVASGAVSAEEERVRMHIMQHPASLRQQAAVTALVELLRSLNVALSGALGVDFAQLATPPRAGGCCG